MPPFLSCLELPFSTSTARWSTATTRTREAWVDAFAEAGIDGLRYDRVRRSIGMGGDKLMPQVSGLPADRRGRAPHQRTPRRDLPIRLPAASQRFPQRSRAASSGFWTMATASSVASSAQAEELDPLARNRRRLPISSQARSSSDDAEAFEAGPRHRGRGADPVRRRSIASDHGWTTHRTTSPPRSRAGIEIVGLGMRRMGTRRAARRRRGAPRRAGLCARYHDSIFARLAAVSGLS